MTATPAGWYTDPNDPNQERYWSGDAWTEHFRPKPVAAPPVASVTTTNSAQFPVASATRAGTTNGLASPPLLVGIGGTALILLSAVLKWVSASTFGFTEEAGAFEGEFPWALTSLDEFEQNFDASTILTPGLVMLAFCAVLIPSVFARGKPWVPAALGLCGIVVLIYCGLTLKRFGDIEDRLGSGPDLSFSPSIGFYAAMLGAVVLIVSAVMLQRE